MISANFSIDTIYLYIVLFSRNIGLQITVYNKVIHLKYYKHLKKGPHQSHLGTQKMGWFLAD